MKILLCRYYIRNIFIFLSYPVLVLNIWTSQGMLDLFTYLKPRLDNWKKKKRKNIDLIIMAKKPFYHTNHGHFLYDLLINPNKWISLEKQSGHWRPFTLIFFKTRDDMLSQCLVLPITKKVIFYKLVLRQQPLTVLIKIRIRQKK